MYPWKKPRSIIKHHRDQGSLKAIYYQTLYASTRSLQEYLIYNRNLKEILRHFVTVDETWTHRNTLEFKEQSKQLTSPFERAQKKVMD